ncbi:uncharacterized protein LOC132547246 [Ylistrum balloti]|uniref:uncharacterized protein LOC132547246 n=1 Tax=Ylistrum balloti TaxID=509963 RepID=UPI002905E213|nr:uncharacterized protein LOC132547246 [Ylistrum balloti]
MGAICSTKSSTVINAHRSSSDQSDSAVQRYVTLDSSAREVKPSSAGTRVEYISNSETSLQKDNSKSRDIPDHTMPGRLQQGDVTGHTDSSPAKMKQSDSDLEPTFTKLKQAKKLFEDEMKNENRETELEPVMIALRRDVSDIFEKYDSPSDREKIGNFMARNGLVDTLVDLYGFVIKDYFEQFSLRTVAIKADYKIEIGVLEEIRKIAWNFSDRSSEFQDATAKTHMFGFLAKDLLAMGKHELCDVKEHSFPFTSAVNIIHNCSRSGTITKAMYTVTLQPGDGDMVSLQTCLTPFLGSTDTYVKVMTLLSLAYIMNDKESEKMLGTDKTILNFLLEMIRKATTSENRRHQGFSVEELLDGLSRLAQNDTNKREIMEIANAYTLIREIVMEDKEESETIAAVKTIQQLGFDESNRQKVMSDRDFVKTLKDLKQSSSKKLAEAAGYACFVITGSEDADMDDTDDDETRHNTSDSMVPSKKKKKIVWTEQERSRETIKTQGHIMLSYNWTHKPILREVYTSLTWAGFPVWMDIHHMEGNLLDAMSQAVLESDVVIICASEQYGDSANCRLEAEFARKKKKTIIPLMMQKNANLPGWLDMLLGDKLYYRFYDINLEDNRPLFEERMEEVMNAIRSVLNQQNKQDSTPRLIPQAPETKADKSKSTVVPPDNTAITPIPTKSNQSPKIGRQLDMWTEDDKDRWLRDKRLHTYAGMKDISCEQLQFLVKISIKAPEFFYRTLKEEVGLRGLEQLMRVSNAIEELV